MTIEEQVFALLGADTGVAAFLAPSNIKPPGDWQNLARPYIVHFPAAVDPIYTHEGLAKLTPWDSYQVSCFADSWSSARLLAIAVRNALTGVHGNATFFWREQRRMPYEEDVRVHHIMVDFQVFESL